MTEPDRRTWILDFGATKPLSLNGSRPNYHVKARGIRTMRTYAHRLAEQAKIPPLGRAIIELHYTPRFRGRRDPFNLIATLKPCEDGIVDAGVLPDDTPEFSVPTVPVIDEPSGLATSRLYIVVREVTP